VKAREPQQIESRKRVLLLHGTKSPLSISTILTTFAKLTQPHSVKLNKKNENIHPFEDPSSLEFLAGKNECGVVVFGTHSKKRPNNVTLLRIFDNHVLDMVELLLTTPEDDLESKRRIEIQVEMKPMILFAGSQWEDTSSSEQAAIYRTLRSILLDLFQGEEIPAIDVAGLQYILMVAAGESANGNKMDDPANKPVVHLRWYKVNTKRSTSPKIPRVELEPVGPVFDFRVGRFRDADPTAMKEAMKHGRRPNEARTKKNIETDLVGDKIGRVHLGKQDLSQLQTRKMKGLKRSHADLEDEEMFANGDVDEDDVVSDNEDMEDGGMQLDDDFDSVGSSVGGSGDDISIGDHSDHEMGDGVDDNTLPKRQKLR
jgi:ribosome production factor 2